MSKALKPFDLDNAALPAHLQPLGGQPEDEWETGTASGFPVISTKGKVFHMKRGDDVTLIAKDDDAEEPETKLKVIVLKTNRGISRTYYEGAYVEGSDDPPTCYSNDGIIPAADAEDRQAKKCAACPKAQWGSRITENNKKGKACSEVKRLAVALWIDPAEPALIRIPPTSLKNWDRYVHLLKKRGVNPSQVVTQIRFDPAVTHQNLTFEPIGFVTPDDVPAIEEALAHPSVELIIGAANDPGDIEESDDADDATPPARQRPAKQAGNAKPEPEPVDEEDVEAAEAAVEAAAKKKKADAAKKRKLAAAKKKLAELEAEDADEEEEEPAEEEAKEETVETEGDLDGLGDLDLDDLNFD